MKRAAAAIIHVLAWGLFLCGPQARAQAALANGDFNADLAGWNLQDGAPSVSAFWIADDSGGNAGSGSAELRDGAPGSGGIQTVLGQCVDLSSATLPIPFRASARVEAEGEPAVVAYLQIEQHSDAVCGSYIGLTQTRLVNHSQPAWQSVSDQFTPFDGSVQSVRVKLGVEKPPGSGGGGAVRFDAVQFGATVEPTRLKRWTFDAGGGSSSGGGIALIGSIGQPDPGSASSAGVTLQSGFWFAPGRASPPSGDLIFSNDFE